MKRLLASIAVAAVLIVLAMPAYGQSTFTWEVRCVGDGIVGSGFSVTSQLMNGSLVNEMFTSCFGPFSGTVTIPAAINGIPVIRIFVDAGIDAGFPAACSAFKEVIEPLPFPKNLSVNIHLSLPNTVTFFGPGKVDCPMPGGSADFSLSIT